MKPVYVQWKDAVSFDEWTDGEVPELHVIHTLGFLIHEDKEKIVIAMQVDPDSESRSMEMAIPRGMIVKLKKLKL
jgi:hypothetical protein